MSESVKRRLRAVSDQDKEQVIMQLLTIWQEYPSLRLGQLIANAFPPDISEPLAYIEDSVLIAGLQRVYPRKRDYPEGAE